MHTRGYVLVPALLMISVVAAVAYLLNVEGGQNANAALREMEIVRAQLVAEAGLADAAWQLSQNTTCTGYASLPTTGFTNHNYAVTVTPNSGSPVSLDALGTTADDVQYKLTRSVAVYEPPTATVIRPSAGVGKDTNLRSGGNADKNYGSTRNLLVSNFGVNDVALFQFDVSALPPAAVVSSAQLVLDYGGANSITNGIFDVHRVTSQWWEGSEDGNVPVTAGSTYNDADGAAGSPWGSPGGDYDSIPLDSILINTLAEMDATWNVRDAVQSWVSGAAPNYGFLVRASGGLVDNADFTASDHPGAGGHPRLEITYRCQCGEACAAGAVAANIVVSSQFTTKVGNLNNARDGQISELDVVTNDGTMLFADSWIAPGNIDAVHRLPDGRLVFSAGSHVVVAGLSFGPGDLVVWDPNTSSAALYFNGLVFADEADINAVYLMEDGHVLLSTKDPETLAGLNFSPDDVVEYDPVNHAASLFFDGSLFTASEDIDALHIHDDGHVLLSTTSNADLGGYGFDATEVIEYDAVADTAGEYAHPISSGDDVDAFSLVDDAAPLPLAPPPPAICQGTIIDSFHRATFTESDGSVGWTSDWDELDAGEAAGPFNGLLQIVNDLGSYRLRYEGKAGGIERTLDLSGYTSATLSFDYRRVSMEASNEIFTVKIKSAGPGGNENFSIAGPGTDSAYVHVDLNIDSVAGGGVELRISNSVQMDAGDYLFLDNFVICAD